MPNTEQHTSTWWATSDLILPENNEGMETDTLKVKYGDGVSVWADLDYSGFKRVGRNLVVDPDF